MMSDRAETPRGWWYFFLRFERSGSGANFTLSVAVGGVPADDEDEDEVEALGKVRMLVDGDEASGESVDEVDEGRGMRTTSERLGLSGVSIDIS